MLFSKKIFAVFVFLFSVLTTSFAQEKDSIVDSSKEIVVQYPNIVKINTFSLAFSNVSLIYERSIIPRVTAGIGVGYKFKGSATSLLDIDNELIKADFGNISGFTITPEAKYYLRTCDAGKLEGFYTGVYFRYTNYKSSADFNYTPTSYPMESYMADMQMTELGVGIQLGYQMIINDRFSIDFLFIGPRYATYKLAYEFDREPSEAFLSDLSDSINEVIERFGGENPVNIEHKNERKADASFSFANTRFGISLGYAF